MTLKPMENKTSRSILLGMLLSAFSLFVNGFGVYLTMHAGIGAAPWDVLNQGVSRTLGILYGDASIAISLMILAIDIILKEPIGLSMFIDAVVVGKSVDFFNAIHIVPKPTTLPASIGVMIIGLFIIGYTQMTYMIASLGSGPRDTLLVGLGRRLRRIPIGAVSIGLLSTATLIGWVLGGDVNIGTLICAGLAGPIMQLCFMSAHFDATKVRHQQLKESFRIFADSLKNK